MQDLTTILSCLEQPAFVQQEGKTVLCNAVAEHLGMNTAPFQAAFVSPPQTQPVMHFSCDCLGHSWTVRSCLLACGRLFILQQTESAPTALAMTSKAIRMPLQEMFTSAQKLFLRLEEQEDDTIQTQAAVLSRGLFRLLRLAENLTDGAAENGVAVQAEKARIDSISFFHAFADKVRYFIQSTGRTFEFQCAECRYLYLNMDQLLVQRAVLNLLSNAIANTPKGGTVTLRVRPSGTFLQICVENEGSVLAPGELSGLLERYRQPTVSGGAGFGLSVVRAAARMHGGTVLVEAIPEGGLRFVFTLQCSGSQTLRVQSPGFGRNLHADLTGGYDPCLVQFSDVLDAGEYDSRKIF